MLFTVAVPFSVFAKEGDQISFTSRYAGGSGQFSAGDYIGVCCQPGVDPDSSGTATMQTKYDNTHIITKIAYYYGYNRDWVHNYDNFSGGTDESYASALMSMMQASVVGLSSWKSYAERNQYTTNYINSVETWYNNVANMSVNIPSGFEVYRCNPSNGSQDFVVWGFSPVGYLKLEKASANPSITG